MISERQLAKGYTSFWRDVAPMLEPFWRAESLQATRVWEPISSQVERFSRAYVSELSFEAFAESTRHSVCNEPARLAESVKSCSSRVAKYLSRFTDQSSQTLVLDDKVLTESVQLAARLCGFISKRFNHTDIVLRPQFAGCGNLMAAEGDLIAGPTLIEVKSGQRSFKSADLRQALIYCALNRLRPVASITKIALLNPRMGIFWESDLDKCCQAIAGKASPELFDDITNFVSEPEVYS